MQLNNYTTYSLQALIYLNYKNGTQCTINEVAEFYNISRHHLIKIISDLVNKNYIHSMCGKSGGITLARPADKINIGTVVRDMEFHFNLATCFQDTTHPCAMQPLCGLKNVLLEAKSGFFSVLDNHLLSDILINKNLLDTSLSYTTIEKNITQLSLSEETENA